MKSAADSKVLQSVRCGVSFLTVVWYQGLFGKGQLLYTTEEKRRELSCILTSIDSDNAV